jgi:hypothetical protein
VGDVREALERIGKGLRLADVLSQDVPLTRSALNELREAHEALAALRPPADDAAIERAARAMIEESEFCCDAIGEQNMRILARAAIKAYQETARDPA